MNAKVKTFVKNFSHTVTANTVAFLVSALVVLIVPKRLGAAQYGYFQLYTLYTSYVGFFHFGWVDGMYLRYGGKEYSCLDRPMFLSQFWMLSLFELLISAGIAVYGLLAFPGAQKSFVIVMTGVCTLLMNPRYYLTYVLQATNRIKEYSFVTTLERLLYFVMVVAMLALGIRDYRMLIVADLAGKAVSLALAVFYCKEIVFGRPAPARAAFRETREDIRVGFKLMFANVASLLIVGIVRLAIEREWDVETFGKVSLTLSVSNLLMIFINAVSSILFPALRRTSGARLPDLYKFMRNFLMVGLLGMLLCYYPAKVILSKWLPAYADALTYMALMFPMCVFESKSSMLVSTYLKTLRREKTILLINVSTVALSFATTFVTVFLLKNLTLAVLSIVLLQAFRCLFGEALLSKSLGISVVKDALLEIAMTVVFIASAWLVRSWVCVPIYAAAYAAYLLIKRRDVVSLFDGLRALVRQH